MSDFDRTIFWPEFKAAGFLRAARVRQEGHAPVDCDVKYTQPTDFKFGGAIGSQEHSIKYQHSDLPYLGEGSTVEFLDAEGEVIRAERFKVRQASAVSDDPGDDRSGFFRHALLTRTP